MALALRLSKYLLSSPGMSRSSEMLALMTLHPKGICAARRTGYAALSYLDRAVTALLHLPPAEPKASLCLAKYIAPCIVVNWANWNRWPHDAHQLLLNGLLHLHPEGIPAIEDFHHIQCACDATLLQLRVGEFSTEMVLSAAKLLGKL